MRTAGWIGLAVIGAGCASSVRGDAGDAAVADRSMSLSDASTEAATALDALIEAAPDAATDAPRARVCPPIPDEDVQPVDAGARPYVADLSIGSGAVSCARMSDATLRCTSINSYGELGLGAFGGPLRRASVVPGLNGVEQVATSIMNAVCARLLDGTVRCWGSNQHDVLGVGHEGDETCTHDVPCRTSPTTVPGLTDVVDLAAGPVSFCAVRRDGEVWCWGGVEFLLPGHSSPVPMRVLALSGVAKLWSTTWGWVARLRSGETVLAAPGSPDVETLPIPPEAEIAESSDSAATALCFRLPDGSARCLGDDSYGTVGDGTSRPSTARVTIPADPGLCGVRSVVCGFTNTCALTADRGVWCWGQGDSGALGAAPPDTCRGYGGAAPEPCATRPVRVEGLDRVERLFVGFEGGCALRFDHELWCWGAEAWNATGALARVDW